MEVGSCEQGVTRLSDEQASTNNEQLTPVTRQLTTDNNDRTQQILKDDHARPDTTAAQAMLYGIGLTDEDLKKSTGGYRKHGL